MIRNRVIALATLTLLALAGASATREQIPVARAEAGEGAESIVFVCQNGVAMSIWSALTFDRLAAERGLAIRAISRASTPSFTRVPLRMRLALRLDGLRVGEYRPQVVTSADLRRAERVIVIDTQLPANLSRSGVAMESWAGFPPMREEYFASRAALRQRVEALVAQLAARSR
jgi:protein-tyrosine-phosphatase